MIKKKKRRFNILNLLFRRKKQTIYIKKELPEDFVLNKDSEKFENKTIWPYHASLKDDRELVIDTSTPLDLMAPDDLKLKNELQKEKLQEQKIDVEVLDELTGLEHEEEKIKIQETHDLIEEQEEVEELEDDEIIPIIYDIIYNEDINDKDETKEDIEAVKDYTEKLGVTSLVDENITAIDTKIQDEKNSLSLDEVAFEKLKDQYVDYERLNRYITKYLNEQQNEIDKIVTRVENNQGKIETSTKLVQEKVTSINRILIGTTLLMASPMIPRTRGGRLLRFGMICFGLFSLANATRVRTTSKQQTTITYENYENAIKNGMTDLSYVSKDIDNALIDIRNLRLDFEQYKECDEYDSMIKNLDALEHKLIAEYHLLQEYNDKLNKSLVNNRAKVKRLEDTNAA